MNENENLDQFAGSLEKEVGNQNIKKTVHKFPEKCKSKKEVDENEVQRIAKLNAPDKTISMKEWSEIIEANLSNTLYPAKLCLAVVAQLLINDITNPFALVLVDVPSAAKTLTLDFFAGLPEIAYPTDKFSPASFVSHSANIKTENLKQIDLLPRIRYKTLIVRDMATVFSEKQDVLEEGLGVLTRVLDGDGYQRESGVHGGRGYSGEYPFMMLAASTPLRNKVWEVMGSLGARLFFFNTRQPDPSEEELIQQVSSSSLKEKRKVCLNATNNLLRALWNKYSEGIDWDKSKDAEELKRMIAKTAIFLARLRGVAKKSKEYENDDYFIQVEKASRLNQLLYNFARGNAVINDRLQINQMDIGQALIIAVESAPPKRASFVMYLLRNGGKSNAAELETAIGVSRPTVLKLADKLIELKVISRDRENFGQTEATDFVLKEKFLPLCSFFSARG